ncbi:MULTISPECIES: Rnf-Nqr domain containing protein [Pseudomonas]|uniref:Electron transport complex protein RnfE n=1 Tax=Pseudomonas gessardii TaxID=78544 RepID=A0A7Y1MWA6_9PSED|nr:MULTISPECIES: Rnf-Nqr domain containing protein [Pseudomonas]MBH3420784.1 hypothetical protein [Pseudomonas gessardii]MCF4979035.1 hypothetical protein [Pseudomonas gessardii]MCF4991457.1 hypothetical protein [Pseudomonas gessardii]MCF5086319.1 hypothetical protein [Pseudomonas gessardii]MCF5097978.1 hypothetical protein [Pseudomonas gessardii]
MTKPFALASLLWLPALLGVSATPAGAAIFWGLWALTMTLHGWSCGWVRNRLSAHGWLTANVLLATTWASCAHLVAQALAFAPSTGLGAYLALIGVQCVLLEHDRPFAANPRRARLQLFAISAGLLAAITLLRLLPGSGIATLAPTGFILLGLLLAGWQAWTQRRTPH